MNDAMYSTFFEQWYLEQGVSIFYLWSFHFFKIEVYIHINNQKSIRPNLRNTSKYVLKELIFDTAPPTEN